MPRIKFNHNGSGTKKESGKAWYEGAPLKSVEKFFKQYHAKTKDLSKSDLHKFYRDELKSLDSKDKKINQKITALRIALLRKADDLDENVESVDASFIHSVSQYGKDENVQVSITGKRKRSEDDEADDDEQRPAKTTVAEAVENENENEEGDVDMDVEDANKTKKKEKKTLVPVANADDDIYIPDKNTSKEKDVNEEEKKEEEEEEEEDSASPKQDDASIEAQPSESQTGEQSSEIPQAQEPLEEIELTHPSDIQEKEQPQVQDNVRQVDSEIEALPDAVVPDGQNENEASGDIMDPETFNEQQQEGMQELIQQQQQDELPSFEEMDGEYEEELNEYNQDPPTSYLGFDNGNHPIVIQAEASPLEIQDVVVSVLKKHIGEAMDIEDESELNHIAHNFLSDAGDAEPSAMQDETNTSTAAPLQEEEEETKQGENDSMNVEESAPPQDYQDDVEFKEPTKQMVRQQERERVRAQKQAEKEQKERDKRENAINALHSKIFGQKSVPIITDDDEAAEYKKWLSQRKNAVLQYISSNVLKYAEELKAQKARIIGQIKSGHARSEFDRSAQDRPRSNEQTNIRKGIQNQLVRDLVEAKELQRTSDILAEVADYTIKNRERIQQKMDPKFAISKFIYPTFRDPDTYNVVKYRTDADGQIIIDKATGHPIIESISAVNRDDTKKFLDQKKAVDSTDLASPYFPIYGKQARDYFSKLEFSYLGRMFQGPTGTARGSIPKPLNLRVKITELLKEISRSVELKDQSLYKDNLCKQWLELEVLKSSYQRFNQYADYQYIQDKRELGEDGTLFDKDATVAAQELLQNITVQKLLDLLAQEKQNNAQGIQQAGDDQSGAPSSGPGAGGAGAPPKQPGEVGAIEPTNDGPDADNSGPVDPSQQEEKTSEMDLNSWAKKSNSTFGLNAPQAIYRLEPFPAFGGMNDDLTDL